MRRKFTRKEFRTFIADGKRQGVTYSKKEKRFMKKITFKDCFICPEGMGMIMIDPNPSPLHNPNYTKEVRTFVSADRGSSH